MEWRPIETAPKKDKIDVWARTYDNSARKWEYLRITDVHMQSFSGSRSHSYWEPLFWMPLPPPPESK